MEKESGAGAQPEFAVLERLIGVDEDDVYCFLGIQAERLMLAQTRAAQRRPVPEWTDEEALAKVLSRQRASSAALRRYVAQGRAFADGVFGKHEARLGQVLHDGGALRPEILQLAGDPKALASHLTPQLVDVLRQALPEGHPAALTSLAAALALVLLRIPFTRFKTAGVGGAA